MSKSGKTHIDKGNKVVTGSKKSPPKTTTILKEYNFKTVALIGFLVSLLLLVFGYSYFGSYFEMNDDGRYVMAMKGFASPKPFDNFATVYVFTIDLYIYLYKHFPNVGWYGLSMFLMLWGALFNIYISIYLLSKNRIHYLLTLALFIAFYFLIFLQNEYWMNFTRPSMLAACSFIVLLSVLYIHDETLRKNKWILIFPVITYIFAHLTRLDAGYLGIAFGSAFAVLFIFKQKNVLPFILKFIAPVVVFILLIKVVNVYLQKDKIRNHDFVEKAEIIRQLIDYRNIAAYVPKDVKDTIAYNAMMYQRYCNDDKIFNVDYFKKLTNKSPLLESGNDKKFDDEFGAFTKSLDNENSAAKMFNYGLFLVFLIWLLVGVKNNYLNFIKYILFQIGFLIIVAGMSYYMKLPARIYNPLLVMLTCGNIIFAFSFLRFDNKKLNYLFIVPLLFVLFGIQGYAKSNSKLISDYKQYGRINKMTVDDMNTTFSNTVFIPTNLRSWEMHSATDPVKEINLKNKNSYVYLTIELCTAPETNDQLIDKFGTNDHAKLFKNISEMNNVVFISTDNFNNFLRTYYHYLYNQDYYFEKVKSESASFYQYTGLDYYRLKKQ